MAFGPWMEVVDGDVRLRLGAVRRDEVGRYIAPEAGFGLQSYEVTRYLGLTTAPTQQGEEEWWDRAAKPDENYHWGIYLPTDGDGWKLVGTTTLELRPYDRRRAESGFLLFERSHWRQRIASVSHLARTRFAFDELDLLAISSFVDLPNAGSRRALEGVGYVQTGVRYSVHLVGGAPVDAGEYLLANPREESWRYFWRRPDDAIPAEFHAARPKTVAALERAADAVRFL